jgi:hypothetical protein
MTNRKTIVVLAVLVVLECLMGTLLAIGGGRAKAREANAWNQYRVLYQDRELWRADCLAKRKDVRRLGKALTDVVADRDACMDNNTKVAAALARIAQQPAPDEPVPAKPKPKGCLWPW